MAYEARKNNSNPSGNSTSPMDKKQQEQEASKNVAKTAAKGAATYFAGPAGGKAVDAIANTKLGQKVLDTAGKNLNKIPGMGKAAKKLDDSGAVKAADKAIDVAGGQGGAPGGGTPGATPGMSGGNTPGSQAGTQFGQNQFAKNTSGEEPFPKINQASRNGTPTDEISGMPDMDDEYKSFGDRIKEMGGGFGPGLGFGGLGGKSKSPSISDADQDSGKEKEADLTAVFQTTMDAKTVLIMTLPFVFFLFIAIGILGAAGGGGVADFDDALGASSVSGGQTGEIIFEPSSKDAKKFYERLNDVKLEMQEEGKTVDVLKVAAVYHILNITNNKYDYDYMTKSRIKEIAEAMFSNNMYSEEVFRENLTKVIFQKYFPKFTESERETLTDEVFDYIERYYSFIGEEMPLEATSTCGTTGSCSYNIKGFYLPGRGNVVKQMNVSNLQVRLMECGAPYGNGSYTTPINQPLVPFEDYISGVAYAEIGSSAPIEAIKAQMVAARSYALARPTAMGNSKGKKLADENGQWILQISSCVSDQVFCNINEGCSWLGGGDGQGGICVSGIKSNAVRTRAPLAQNHTLRAAASATTGEVLVNDQGYIIEAGYLNTEQNRFIQYANQGMNYKQILMEVYNSSARNYRAADIVKMSCQDGTNSVNCGSASTGPYASWKQYKGPWKNIPMGRSGKTVGQIGCLVTSISMLIAKSGVPTVIQNFNPGTFVEHLNKHGGFDGGGNFQWASVSTAAPTFKFMGKIRIAGYSKQQKLNKIIELINQGYYVVAEVKGNTGQHWVAIDAVHGSTIVMMDPGRSGTDMWAQYNWVNTSTLAYFKAG